MNGAKLLSPARYATGYYQRRWHQAAKQAPLTVVLVYHRVRRGDDHARAGFAIERGVRADVFERQMRFMRRHFEPVACSAALDAARPSMSFAVTFDDGYDDNYEVAAPILDRLGIPATFFVISDFVGNDRLFWWERVAGILAATTRPRLDTSDILAGDSGSGTEFALQDGGREAACEYLCAALRGGPVDEIEPAIDRLAACLKTTIPDSRPRDRLMNWEELRDLIRRGHEIGGHTATHVNLATAPEAMLEQEIGGAIATMTAKLEQPVTLFAYPYGHFDAGRSSARHQLETSGCRLAFVGNDGVVTGSQDPLALPRTRLNRHYGFACAYNVHNALAASAR